MKESARALVLLAFAFAFAAVGAALLSASPFVPYLWETGMGLCAASVVFSVSSWWVAGWRVQVRIVRKVRAGRFEMLGAVEDDSPLARAMRAVEATQAKLDAAHGEMLAALEDHLNQTGQRIPWRE